MQWREPGQARSALSGTYEVEPQRLLVHIPISESSPTLSLRCRGVMRRDCRITDANTKLGILAARSLYLPSGISSFSHRTSAMSREQSAPHFVSRATNGSGLDRFVRHHQTPRTFHAPPSRGSACKVLTREMLPNRALHLPLSAASLLAGHR